jgi:hypothetical protein
MSIFQKSKLKTFNNDIYMNQTVLGLKIAVSQTLNLRIIKISTISTKKYKIYSTRYS